MRPAFLALLLVLAGVPTGAPRAADEGTRLLRFPDVSRTHITFVYAGDLYVVGRGGGTAQRLTAHEGLELYPKFSPDGRWIAYVSNETGREEVYVRSADATGPRRKVSREGGLWPVWSRSWDIFFSKDASVWAVRMDSGGAVAGPERLVMDSPELKGLEVDQTSESFFDVIPGGKRLVMRFGPKEQAPLHYTVIVNWSVELKGRAPAGTR
jgi:hypothetical protein